MPTYKVKDPNSGRTLKLTGDSAPTEQELNDIFGRMTAVPKQNNLTKILSTSEPVRKTGDPVIDALIFGQKEIIGPVARGANTALFGIPRAITRKVAGEDYAKQAFPEQSTTGGKILRAGSEVAGFTAGPGRAATATARGTGRILGRTAVRGLTKKTIQGAVGGVTGGALTGNTLEERKRNAAIGGVVGGVIPLTRAVGSGIKKSTASYINDVVVPKAYNSFKNNVNRFSPGIQKFAKEKLKIPETAISTIKNKGTEYVNKVKNLYGRSTDVIYKKIDNGLNLKREEANIAYRNAINSLPKGRNIDIQPSIDVAGKKLMKLGLITKNGNITEFGKSEIAKDTVYGKLLDFYQSADAISGVGKLAGKEYLTAGQMAQKMTAGRHTYVNKDQYTFLRDKLNSLYRSRPSDINVAAISDKFYSSGEAAGAKGLQAARALQRDIFSFEDQYKDKFGRLRFFKEGKLDRFHESSFSKQDLRDLQRLEKYLGVDIIDDLDALTASKYLDKLEQYDISRFSTDLNKAVARSQTNFIKEQYRDLLGDYTDDVFNDIIAHRRARLAVKGAKIAGGLTGYELLRRKVSQPAVNLFGGE